MLDPIDQFPRIVRVRQTFERPRVDDVPAAVGAEIGKLLGLGRIKPGQSVALTAGSRGIQGIPTILRAVVDALTDFGAKPFIVPAMGSHGGGTAEGQRDVLTTLGVTEQTVGCPIRASMETIEVCQSKYGFPVHFDKIASTADHTLVIGRVKAHTNFTGEWESGLMKMMLIGLGKHEGAKIYHRAFMDYSFPEIVRDVAAHVIRRCKIAGGLAILENGYEETAIVEAVAPEAIESREKELLVTAKALMPRIPFDRLDILLVDQMGKNLSGSGMDMNVVGRKFTDHMAGPDETPKIKRIAPRALTPETKGNAAGIGLAEFARSRVLRDCDLKKTRINCITSLHPTGAMLPIDFETDHELLSAMLPTIGLTPPERARLLWIRNTLDLVEFEVGEALLEEAEAHPRLEVLTEPRDLPFDVNGNLPDDLNALRTDVLTATAH